MFAVDAKKRARLEAAGWRVGDAEEFLGLTPEEVSVVEVKIALSDYMRQLRRDRHWTQAQLAHRIGSSQSRVAKMEAADPTVSIDLIMKSLFALGASATDVGRIISTPV